MYLTIVDVWSLGMTIDLIGDPMGSPAGVGNANMCGKFCIKVQVING